MNPQTFVTILVFCSILSNIVVVWFLLRDAKRTEQDMKELRRIYEDMKK